MLKEIKFESKIELGEVPIQWISEFELYYPDLPNFPIVYVHVSKNNKRVYGFPASISFKIKDNRKCDVEILFLSNEDLDASPELKALVKSELEGRFGISNKVSLEDVVSSCNGNKEYEKFFKELWKYVSKASGDYVPYGKFYEEVYSMVRFVSAWQPKTGRQSEMRMLYNFMSIFGEGIEVRGNWNHLEFFLTPAYDDVKNENFEDFPKFGKLFSTLKKIWKIYFTKTSRIGSVEIKSMEGAWPQDKESFIREVSYPLLKENKLNVDDKLNLERLVDAFNRHPWRSSFFIWSIMNIKNNNFREWDKEFFEKFYLNKNGVGISEKVVACFLQQGFENEDVIPIDTWVESFYELALGIETKEEFFNSFSNLGKLERVIWLVGQSKKTNIKTFFDMLWCIRYGDTGNNELRGPNPISCYECKLRGVCPSYSKIRNGKTLIKDVKDVRFDELKTRKGNVKGEIITTANVIREADSNKCLFICITEDKIPKKIFAKRGNYWKLIDEFSGYLLDNQKTNKINKIVNVEELVEELPPFFS